ncbi:MAG TPA: nucleotidyltransferase family protein [Burkholderiaceae bacterium]|nr:nucleotidyltransferase family protein [Burkholderiaceae bacterium]
MAATAGQFIQDALQNRHNRAILDRLGALALPDAWLVAGCLFQTVWNLRSGHAPEAGIKDYDLFYFDASDLSASAEAYVQTRVQDCFADLGVPIEIKNQARVHTWYPAYFGYPYAPLASSRDGMDRFLVRCTCVGLQPSASEGLTLYAPNGVDDLYQGILQPNALCNHRPLFEQKAASYQSRWDWLETLDFADAPP